MRQYVALGVLFVIAAGYEALLSRHIFHGLRQPEGRYGLPFAVDPLTATITDSMSAERWGIRRGDLLVLYTDGVSEAMNPQDEEWGEALMMEALGCCHGLSAQQTLEYTMAGADAFASAAPQHDDMTLVVLRVV